jgi:CTP synthase (UTP-ammonia lyase)
VLGLAEAGLQETDPAGEGTLVVTALSCSLVGVRQEVFLVAGTALARVYGRERATEEFRCRYGLNPAYRAALEAAGLRVAAVDAEGQVRAVELPGHPFYVATLFLPQLSSAPGAPHPLILAYLASCGR